ncbi:NUDIX hydrolase [Kibdelosporangium phytohabitans]|uniref:NUDIX hydrolase n=1 Tax=Kibdelosporangium phytohabitans TaxID=860235 RepID=A0A0N9HIQ5_9PSEU|nr:NUDIX domain-containing protein [Kibdelosporangium phytohabitans]ALG05857.1 NUDIX hydrolase [Kibdelosporangium phytohabitans]MBE1466110.1 ADP-ribose pyrophosphatase YjhB (NUDIX family) [Kibdelosporangium phytohabitans]
MARLEHYQNPAAPKADSIVVEVAAFVLDADGRLLMVRRSVNDHLYALPGGVQEVGETVSVAAVRRTAAETGVDIAVSGLIGVYSDPEHVVEFSGGAVRQEFSVCFRGRPIGGELRTSADGNVEVLWVDRSLLPELTIHPSVRLRIQHGFDERAGSYFA